MADVGNNIYRTDLEGVRGPLGVVLYLIRKDNLDIYNIPISTITKEYLEYIDTMEKMNIELAGDFFVMAATLMRIKAQMLLRKDDSEEDPRQELVRSLLEYQKMVEAANTMKEIEDERMKMFTRPVPQSEKEFEPEVEMDLNLYELMRAFREIVANFDANEVREIDPEEFTIEEKITAILAVLASEKQIAFSELFSRNSSRLELVVTFVALLELIRVLKVKVKQEGAFNAIWLYEVTEEERNKILEATEFHDTPDAGNITDSSENKDAVKDQKESGGSEEIESSKDSTVNDVTKSTEASPAIDENEVREERSDGGDKN